MRETSPHLISKRSSLIAEPEVIHSWSAPRSTQYYSHRDDIQVVDEPLYAPFLKATCVDRPYRDELLSKMECNGEKVVMEQERRNIGFVSISIYRLLGFPSEVMSKGKHFILIRNPLNILPSFEKIHSLSFLELGLGELVSIYSDLCQMGTPPAIIDADELQRGYTTRSLR